MNAHGLYKQLSSVATKLKLSSQQQLKLKYSPAANISKKRVKP